MREHNGLSVSSAITPSYDWTFWLSDCTLNHCDFVGVEYCFFFYGSGDHRDLHRVVRRQRQMCIRDRRGAAQHVILDSLIRFMGKEPAKVTPRPRAEAVSYTHLAPTRLLSTSYAVFCLKKKTTHSLETDTSTETSKEKT